MRLTGKQACTLRVSIHSYVIINRFATVIGIAWSGLKPRAVPFDHVDDKVVHLKKKP